MRHNAEAADYFRETAADVIALRMKLFTDADNLPPHAAAYYQLALSALQSAASYLDLATYAAMRGE